LQGDEQSNEQRNEAYNGESVIVKGSNAVYGWERDGTSNVWKATFSIRDYFGNYNPYGIALRGYKLRNKEIESNRTLGEVYMNGAPLASSEQDVIESVYRIANSWRSTIDTLEDNDETNDKLTIYVNFGGRMPALSTGESENVAEIKVREQIFAPATYNLGFITVKNIEFADSANQFSVQFWLNWNRRSSGVFFDDCGQSD
jgi:hypothetical protein